MGFFSAVNSLFNAVETVANVVETTATAGLSVAQSAAINAAKLKIEAALDLCEELNINASSVEEALIIAQEWANINKQVEEKAKRTALPARS